MDLTHGHLHVTFTSPGFSTVKREGIESRGMFRRDHQRRSESRHPRGNHHRHRRDADVDVQSAKRQAVLDNQVIQSLPAARGYGALLNAIPALQGGYTP